MKMNEKLIKDVFDEVVKYQPSLAKYNMVDEDSEDEVDFRVLGDLVIKSFPWPIGIELRRLFSGNMRELDRLRLDQIFKTMERTLQFLSFVMISQVWRDKSEGKITLPESFMRDFVKRFSVLSLGTFTWIIRCLGNTYKDQGREWFAEELGSKFDKKFYDMLDFWAPERNEIGHYQINLTSEEIEKRCVEYEEKLTQILITAAFLTKYKLVSVNEINVIKSKNKEASFTHIVNLLNNSDSDFRAKEIHDQIYSDSKSVLLMKTIKSIQEFLNLSPLIIDTHSEVIDSKDKFSIKKDIFMYTKYRDDFIMYIGTEVTEKCDLRSMSNYNILLEEYKELIGVLSK